jgi:hypothetical protein
VSRYNVAGEQVTSQGIQSFIGSIGAIAVQGITNLSWVQKQIAKNVTIQMTFIVRVSCRMFEKISGKKASSELVMTISYSVPFPL